MVRRKDTLVVPSGNRPSVKHLPHILKSASADPDRSRTLSSPKARRQSLGYTLRAWARGAACALSINLRLRFIQNGVRRQRRLDDGAGRSQLRVLGRSSETNAGVGAGLGSRCCGGVSCGRGESGSTV